jgi:hypothetical protein
MGTQNTSLTKSFSIFYVNQKFMKSLRSFNLCVSYTSPLVELHVRKLVNRMKSFLPEFHVRFAFKSMKIGSLFIKDSKPEISKLDTCNRIYQFKCTCHKSYVGRTKRVIRIRAEEHRTFSSA